MVGGAAATLERARPILAGMGKSILHAGPAGAGQVAKVCNNQVLAVQMIATAEAMALGVANGLEPATLAEIMRQSSGGNWSLEKYNPWPGVMPNAPASHGYSGGFMAELMAKDLGPAQAAAPPRPAAGPGRWGVCGGGGGGRGGGRGPGPPPPRPANDADGRPGLAAV